MWLCNAPPNNSLNRSGISMPLIENSSHDAVDSRPVNSSVRRLKANDILQSEEINLVAAASRLSAGGR
jgi:hypothetical protein